MARRHLDNARKLTKMQPFKAWGPVYPNNPSFASEIYCKPSDLVDNAGVPNFAPRIISGPHLSGTTSHAIWIYDLHCQASRLDRSSKPIFHRIDANKQVVGRSRELSSRDIAKMIHKALGVPGGADLQSILREVTISTRTVFLVDHADSLPSEALRWLLINTQQLRSEPELLFNSKVQFIISGAVSLELLTGSPTSDLRLPRVDVPEFNQITQAYFVKSRLKQLDIRISDTASCLLWNATNGDKYLTQLFCCHLTKLSDSRTIGKREISLVLDTVRMLSDKTSSLVNRLDQLISREISFKDKSSLLEYFRGRLSWEELSIDKKRLLYWSGAIRRDNLDIVIRAPVVAEAIERRIRIWNAVVLHEDKWRKSKELKSVIIKKINKLFARARSSALNGRLRNLEIGPGIVCPNGSLSVELTDLTGSMSRDIWGFDGRPRRIGADIILCLMTLQRGDGSEEIQKHVLEVD
jgi:hypothetical protein